MMIGGLGSGAACQLDAPGVVLPRRRNNQKIVGDGSSLLFL